MMSKKINIDEFFDDDYDPAQSQLSKKHIGRRFLPTGKADRVKYLADLIEVNEKVEIDLHQNFQPTFNSTSHERFWILNYLESFYNDQVITDVLWKVKGGKEANVYCCAAHPSTGMDLIAAKIYRPRMFRNLRNDARYRQGREIRDEAGKETRNRREVLAMRKNTRFGKELRHLSWLEAEFLTLHMLHKVGASVPRPVSHGENVIMMEYIGDRHTPAPALNQVNLPASQARSLFDRLVVNLDIMLSNHCVHADFSAYNVLYWEGDFRIIDFPQAVDPRRNPDAGDFFARDVERLCQYFNRYGIRQNPAHLAADLWAKFERENALDAGPVDLDEVLQDALE
jgi:RIO kinase 1